MTEVRANGLRYGVMCTGTTLSRWQRRCLELLREVEGTTLAAALVDARPAPPRRRSLADLRDERVLWRLYDARWVGRRSRAVQRVDCTDLLGDVPRIDLHVEKRGRFSEYAPADEVAAVRELDLDFILRFAFGILRGEILDAARLGVWSFHHDDERVIRGGPPSFWEVERAVPTTGVLFQRLTDRLDGGIPLARATFRTVAHSYPRNRDVVSFGAADLPARVARGVLAGSIDVDTLGPSASDAAIDRPPGNAATARYLGRQAVRVARSQVRSVTAGDRWTVGVLGHLDAPPMDLGRTTPRWVPELVEHGYLADPFPLVSGDRVAILVEEFDTRTRRGVISALVAGDTWQLHSGIIVPDAHASYPCIVRDGDDVYCVPETAKLGRAEAWRCVEYPLRWERAGTVIDGVPIVDPTPFRHDGRWWLLGGRLDDEPNAKLFAWWGDSLFGPWHAHPLNPVVTDVNAGRPAGTPFLHDGRLLRPAQDCARGYGTALRIIEITALDERHYEERVGARVSALPGPYPHGVHTLTHDAGFWVLDAKRRAFDRYDTRAELVARARRLRG